MMKLYREVTETAASGVGVKVGVAVGVGESGGVGVGSAELTQSHPNNDSANCILSGVLMNRFSNRFMSPTVTNRDVPHSARATTGLMLGGSSSAAGMEGEPMSRLPPDARWKLVIPVKMGWAMKSVQSR